jgi:hypothetical protein
MIRAGLFGCGRIGSVHAGSIAASGRAELAWVCDPMPAPAEALAAQYGGTATADVAAVLSDPSVDAVVVASSTPTHVDLLTRGGAGGQGGAVREADRPGHRPGRRVLVGDQRSCTGGHGRLQPAVRPVVRGDPHPDRSG